MTEIKFCPSLYYTVYIVWHTPHTSWEVSNHQALSAEGLNMLFTQCLHVYELYLDLPVPCDGIPWPDLSGIRVLTLGIEHKKNWRILLPISPWNCSKSERSEVVSTQFSQPYSTIGVTQASNKALSAISSSSPMEHTTLPTLHVDAAIITSHFWMFNFNPSLSCEAWYKSNLLS